MKMCIFSQDWNLKDWSLLGILILILICYPLVFTYINLGVLNSNSIMFLNLMFLT